MVNKGADIAAQLTVPLFSHKEGLLITKVSCKVVYKSQSIKGNIKKTVYE